MWALFAVIFVLIFGPVVRSPLGSFGDLSLLSALFFLAWHVIRIDRINRSFLPFCWIAIFLTALAAGNSLLLGYSIDEKTLQPVIRPIKGLIVLLGVYFAIIRVATPLIEKQGPQKTYRIVLLFVYLAVVVHGLIIVLQFFYPGFRELTYAILIDMQVLEANKIFRMPGLAGAGGAQVAAVQGLGFFVGVHLALTRRKYLWYIVGNTVVVVSFLLTGRTGFIMVGISILYVITYLFFRQDKRVAEPSRNQSLNRLAAVVLSVAVVAWTYSAISSAYENNKYLKIAIDRSFKTYFEYRETGEAADETLEALSKMIDIPQNNFILMFGNARLFDNTTLVYESDIGYIRLWWGYGLIGLMAHIAFYLYMIRFILNPGVEKIIGKENIFFGLWFLASIFILNYKEPFFFARMSYPISIIVIMGIYGISSAYFKIHGSKIVGVSTSSFAIK